MQTVYYQTRNFIRHQGNVVDLAAYRQKLAAASGGDWAPEEEDFPAADFAPEAAPVLTLVPPESPALRRERRRRRNVRRLGIVLDLAATAGILVLTVAAVAAFAAL